MRKSSHARGRSERRVTWKSVPYHFLMMIIELLDSLSAHLNCDPVSKRSMVSLIHHPTTHS